MKLHEHLMPNADYFVFSDLDIEDSYVYDVRKLPYFDVDPVRAARFVKLHPHMLFPGYRFAVWLDGNILIHSDLSQVIASFERSGLPVAAFPHPFRSSVYQEAWECVKRKKDDISTVENQIQRYRDANFESSELIESNFMMSFASIIL